MDTYLEFDTASWDHMIHIEIVNSQYKKYSSEQYEFEELFDPSGQYGFVHLPGILVLQPVDGSRSYHVQISLEEENFAIDPTFNGLVIPLKLEENSRLVFLGLGDPDKEDAFKVNAGQYAVVVQSRPLTIEELERWYDRDFPPELIDPDGYYIPKLIRIRLYKTDSIVEPVYGYF
jgi:hypothetical protein